MSKFDEFEKYEKLSKRLTILVKQLGEVMTTDEHLINKEEIDLFEKIKNCLSSEHTER